MLVAAIGLYSCFGDGITNVKPRQGICGVLLSRGNEVQSAARAMTGTDVLRLMDRLTAYPSWMALAAFVLIAAWKAAAAPGPAEPAQLSESERRATVQALAAQEPSFRMRAERNFPGDAWSQDDDFHSMEMQAARRQAQQRGTSLGEVLRAWDDGLRAMPHSGQNPKLTNSVPPCRPRPVY